MPENHPVLEGDTVNLRTVSLADANSDYLAWLHDDEVMEGIATSGYTLDSLKMYIMSKSGQPDVVFYGIIDKNTGKHIGNVKLDFHDAKANVSELGLLIGDKNYWGRGVGYEACRLIMEYGFKTLRLRKIYLAVYESNPGAKRLYEKLGFTLEGALRKHVYVKGNYYDKYLMGIFREEFK
jgi:[ribosomal protein S5]-alanine N-acetyltransferase